MEDPERLDKGEEEILKRIEDWMNHDIETMISGRCNVSCATLLTIYSKGLGGGIMSIEKIPKGSY